MKDNYKFKRKNTKDNSKKDYSLKDHGRNSRADNRRNDNYKTDKKRDESSITDNNRNDNIKNDNSSDLIIGRNAVMEALKNEREINKLIISSGAEGSIRKIIAMAKEQMIPVYYRDRKTLDKLSDNGTHQGVVAFISPYEYCEPQDILDLAMARGEDPFIIILNNLEDPHNLGAVMRSAEGAGAHGIIIPRRRSVSINDTVVKASAGACEYMLCSRVSNMAQTIELLQEKGVWVGACDMDGEVYHKANLTGPIAIVIGNEGKGISRLVREKCDFIVSIPMRGKIQSLNASNAAAVLMYEIDRQRNI